ncbi:MAG: VanW family protein [Candidatus Levybacteria bacterium]|nr:VanW family protein [Candidatus Levybacteria bacterium]
MKQKKRTHKQQIFLAARIFLWFTLGALIGLFFFVSFLVISYRQMYQNRVYPGVFLDGVDFGGKSETDVRSFFDNKNMSFADTKLIFTYSDQTAVTTAKELELGFDSQLLTDQAYSIGRSQSFVSDIYMITKAYMRGIHLPASYRYDEGVFEKLITPFQKNLDIAPVNAEFSYENGRVTEFHTHSDGRKVDIEKLKSTLSSYSIMLARAKSHPKALTVTIPIITVQPVLTLEKVNDLGIKELIGEGTSLFHGSIANRIYNLTLASSRLNGALVKPGETFSFAESVGDITSLTGYKQAYVIENGRTVLGDGGGVCQVSTTLFRAALNAGLPIVERNQHAYRVHYYEEDSPPGIDAAVYVPSVDLKFKNDTGHWLLIQSFVDKQAERLTFQIYGTSDGREVKVSTPVILSQTPAPEPLYQDDPTLPAGVVKQVDWAAAGAKVSFTRDVIKDGKVTIHDTFNSNYRPWQAIYLRGTKV